MPIKRGFARTERVADLIHKALARLLQEGAGENQFHLVTITGVQVSRDLSYAKVYISVLTDEKDKIKETVMALNRDVKALRYALAQAVKLRIVPELKFVYDESISHGFHLSGLIDSALKKSEKK